MSVSYEALVGAMKLVADGIITPEQANEVLNGCCANRLGPPAEYTCSECSTKFSSYATPVMRGHDMCPRCALEVPAVRAFSDQRPLNDPPSRDYRFPVIVGVGSWQGCATACMTCGAQVPDLGPLKTPYFCDGCKPKRVNMNCPHVDCKVPNCDGKHEVTGPHADKPRGGFEFL